MPIGDDCAVPAGTENARGYVSLILIACGPVAYDRCRHVIAARSKRTHRRTSDTIAVIVTQCSQQLSGEFVCDVQLSRHAHPAMHVQIAALGVEIRDVEMSGALGKVPVHMSVARRSVGVPSALVGLRERPIGRDGAEGVPV